MADGKSQTSAFPLKPHRNMRGRHYFRMVPHVTVRPSSSTKNLSIRIKSIFGPSDAFITSYYLRRNCLAGIGTSSHIAIQSHQYTSQRRMMSLKVSPHIYPE